ncbi:MAG: hypothetical protein M1826_003100 [Phylliscum demangeonii]|nr:MAG: hypothetical protein M1826_003100 [Phylliscum demangeonii]
MAGEARDLEAIRLVPEVTTPTTARPLRLSVVDDAWAAPPPADESSPNTPTRLSFLGRSTPLITPSPHKRPTRDGDGEAGLERDDSYRSIRSKDMPELDSDDDPLPSDNDEEGADGGRPSKKKKGQRFYCTGFPPCNLSFTRSEHLARHIRKHTGERPFQCHCARRFSRLDNLRQHAQTVHLNEEIPIDSLAATGTRFQRQVRTDRARPGGARSRASTIGSPSSQGPRGHARNLSASSITSTASSVSVSVGFGVGVGVGVGVGGPARDDGLARPPSFRGAGHAPARPCLSIDTCRAAPDSPGAHGEAHAGHAAYAAPSPAGYSTPTSATYSTGAGSPRFSGHFRSPVASVPHAAGYWDGRSPGRRLSVPSGSAPFPARMASGHPPAPPYFSPVPSSHASACSGQSSAFGSPTSSIFAPTGDGGAPAQLKRRTWHPESRPSVNSPLAQSSVPDAAASPAGYRPLHAQHAQHRSVGGGHDLTAYGTRLPGIESFDQLSLLPPTPPRRETSPMQVDLTRRPALFLPPTVGPGQRRSLHEWDLPLHQNLHQLGIHGSTPPAEAARMPWAVDHPPFGPHHAPPPAPARPEPAPVPTYATTYAPPAAAAVEPAAPVPEPSPTPRRNKRHGWYNGPPAAHQPSVPATAPHRPSPEDSSSSEGVATPSHSSVGEANPSIRHSNGWFDSIPSTPPVDSPKASVSGGAHAARDGVPTYANHLEAGSFYRAPPPSYPLASLGGGYRPDHVGSAPIPGRDGHAAAAPRAEGSNMLRLEALVAVATSAEP